MARSAIFNAFQKQFPGQAGTRKNKGEDVFPTSYKEIKTVMQAYQNIEVYNRCINIITDTCSLMKYDVKDSYGFVPSRPNIKGETISKLLNQRPNPFQDRINLFSSCWADFQFFGFFMMYFDGGALYHVPAPYVTIMRGSTNRISHYVYEEGGIKKTFKLNEIILVSDNGTGQDEYDIVGFPRAASSVGTATSLASLSLYHNNFFKNGSILGVVIETSETLSRKYKERTEEYIADRYSPKKGAFKPFILDNNMKAKTLNAFTFADLKFEETNAALDSKISMALGVPPVLLFGGNNANIRPNVELLLNFTVLPMAKKLESALEAFFGYDIQVSPHEVPAMLPDQDKYWTMIQSAVNNGLITGDEGRELLRFEPLNTPEMTEIRIPQNIAGSNTGVAGEEGGAPSNGDEDE